jgi:hypothetical protein
LSGGSEFCNNRGEVGIVLSPEKEDGRTKGNNQENHMQAKNVIKVNVFIVARYSSMMR